MALIKPQSPKASTGRPPTGLERMLRICFLQQWFNLSDPAMGDALYDSLIRRGFVGVDLHPTGDDLPAGTSDLSREPAPDETTVCKFRHLLERHGLGKQMLTLVNGYLDRQGLTIGTGMIADTIILHPPCACVDQECRPSTRSGSPTRRCTR